jgi:hypothetical protein
VIGREEEEDGAVHAATEPARLISDPGRPVAGVLEAPFPLGPAEQLRGLNRPSTLDRERRPTSARLACYTSAPRGYDRYRVEAGGLQC